MTPGGLATRMLALTPVAEGDVDPTWIPFGTAGLLPRGTVVFVAAAEHAGIEFAIHGVRVYPSERLNDASAAYLRLFENFVRRVLQATPRYRM